MNIELRHIIREKKIKPLIVFIEVICSFWVSQLSIVWYQLSGVSYFVYHLQIHRKAYETCPHGMLLQEPSLDAETQTHAWKTVVKQQAHHILSAGMLWNSHKKTQPYCSNLR